MMDRVDLQKRQLFAESLSHEKLDARLVKEALLRVSQSLLATTIQMDG
jgi:hypothetical protein